MRWEAFWEGLAIGPPSSCEVTGKAVGATFADPVNNKYPIDTPGRIKAAWAYIHQPSNAEKYSDEELRTIKVRIRRAAKAREVALPNPDEFVELMARVRKRKK